MPVAALFLYTSLAPEAHSLRQRCPFQTPYSIAWWNTSEPLLAVQPCGELTGSIFLGEPCLAIIIGLHKLSD